MSVLELALVAQAGLKLTEIQDSQDYFTENPVLKKQTNQQTKKHQNKQKQKQNTTKHLLCHPGQMCSSSANSHESPLYITAALKY